MRNELYHYGVKGQSWGVRRYQNEDGSLTPLGRSRLAMDNFGSDGRSARKTLSSRDISKNKSSKSKTSAKTTTEQKVDQIMNGSGVGATPTSAINRSYLTMSDEELKELGLSKAEIDKIKKMKYVMGIY